MYKTVIKFENVSKVYQLGRTNLRSYKNYLPKIWSCIPALSGKVTGTDKVFYALNDVSFELKQGEALGVVGPNGAGKSTILKLLANTTKPTSGTITKEGRLSALIELGAGFHPELTGRENVYLYGSIMGLKKREIREKFDDIVAFAELEQFIDTPIKHYSSGMYARLGFAVAIHVDPEILLIDEVLAVGDMNFRKKCYERLHEILSRERTTIVFVSHDIYRVQALCKKALFLSKGRIQTIGDTGEVISCYNNEMKKALTLKDPAFSGKRWGTGEVRITSVQLSDAGGKATDTYETSGSLAIKITYHAPKKVDNPAFRFVIQTTDGVWLICARAEHGKNGPDFIEGDGAMQCTFESLPLLKNAYVVGVYIGSPDSQIDYDVWPNAAQFNVTSSQNEGYCTLSAYNGLIHVPAKMLHYPGRAG